MHRVLVIGGGSIGERHVRCFLHTGRAEVSLCENRRERLAEMKQQYALAGAFDDFEKIDLARFDTAVICIPADLHIPLARRLVDAGLHVLCEKPLSVSVDGIDDLIQATKERGVTSGVAFVRRGMGSYRAVKNELKSGRIGDVLNAIHITLYDHRQARPDYRRTYAVDAKAGGGAINDLMSHSVNLIQWLLGPVSRVTAMYDHLQIEDTDVEDTVTILLRFRDSKAMCTLHCSMWNPYRKEELILAGAKGAICVDNNAGRIGVLIREKGEWEWTEGFAGRRDGKGQMDAPFIFEANNFLDAIEGRADVMCTLEEGKHTVEVCLAAHESGRRHRTVDV